MGTSSVLTLEELQRRLMKVYRASQTCGEPRPFYARAATRSIERQILARITWEVMVPIQNEKVRAYTLLKPMLEDGYFPKHLVSKGQDLLRQLAERIERESPKGEAVYVLTAATAESFNQLQEEFEEAESEIETVAREAILRDVEFILGAYGYDFDIEEAMGDRDW
jgi:hypothetical protein